MATIESKLLGILKNKFGGDPQLSDGLVFIGVDSIGMAELTLDLESEFAVTVNEALADVETVQELANYIRDLQADSQGN